MVDGGGLAVETHRPRREVRHVRPRVAQERQQHRGRGGAEALPGVADRLHLVGRPPRRGGGGGELPGAVQRERRVAADREQRRRDPEESRPIISVGVGHGQEDRPLVLRGRHGGLAEVVVEPGLDLAADAVRRLAEAEDEESALLDHPAVRHRRDAERAAGGRVVLHLRRCLQGVDRVDEQRPAGEAGEVDALAGALTGDDSAEELGLPQLTAGEADGGVAVERADPDVDALAGLRARRDDPLDADDRRPRVGQELAARQRAEGTFRQVAVDAANLRTLGDRLADRRRDAVVAAGVFEVDHEAIAAGHDVVGAPDVDDLEDGVLQKVGEPSLRAERAITRRRVRFLGGVAASGPAEKGCADKREGGHTAVNRSAGHEDSPAWERAVSGGLTPRGGVAAVRVGTLIIHVPRQMSRPASRGGSVACRQAHARFARLRPSASSEPSAGLVPGPKSCP